MSLEKLAASAASILQSFYTGIENLLLYLSKALDGSVPNTPSWHRDLLDIASSPTPYRPSIIGASTRDLLVTYLDFRHVVRHGYTMRLRSDRTRDLLLSAPGIWGTTRIDIERFLDSLQNGPVK